MDKNIISNSLEDKRFESVNDFKWCVKYGGEVQFAWKGKAYSITHLDEKIYISEGCYVDEKGLYRNLESEELCTDVKAMSADTADEILEYIVEGDRLRDIITEIEVWDRTI